MNTELPSVQELEKLPLYELISLLDDVQNFEPISYVPSTPIWPWIFGLMAAIIFFLGIKAWKRWKKERYRAFACKEIDQCDHLQGAAYLIKTSQILKRTALTAYPRMHVARLHGIAWLDFLNNSYKDQEFTQGKEQLLLSDPFYQHPDIDKTVLKRLAKKWIRTHQRGKL